MNKGFSHIPVKEKIMHQITLKKIFLASAFSLILVTSYAEENKPAVPASEPLSPLSSESKPVSTMNEQEKLNLASKQLADPLSDIWALFTEFDYIYSKGDLSGNDYKTGGAVNFQPIMPLHLNDEWKLVLRPAVPLLIDIPVPVGLKGTNPYSDYNQGIFDDKTGLADIVLPFIFVPKGKTGSHFNWGFGPTFILPAATDTAFASKKWQAGPAFASLYKTDNFIGGFLAQYWWDFAETKSNSPQQNHGSILYFYFYNLPDAWSVGLNPTITYNDRAPSGNKWNVPVGLIVTKTVKFGRLPVKFQIGFDKSIIREDAFGTDWKIKLNIIPVIPSLIQGNLF
jgi:hypothetical protein